MSYSKIKTAFQTVLHENIEINGRVYFFPNYLQDLNTQDLAQAISTSGRQPNLKGGPLCAIMPPSSLGTHHSNVAAWRTYTITAYFLTTSYTNEAGQVKRPGVNGQSTVPLMDDWEKMLAIAKDTLNVMDMWFTKSVVVELPLATTTIRFSQRSEDIITPVSLQGNERWSGVKVSTRIAIYEDCFINSYSPEFLEQILTIPFT